MAFLLRTPPDKESMKAIAAKFPGADVDAVDLVIRMLICTTELQDLMTEHFTKYNLSQGRFSILMMLLRKADHKAKPIEIADHLGVTRGNMTGLVDNLVRDGLVTREDCARDRRINFVRLTPKGIKHLNKMLPEHYARIGALVADLKESEREVFLRCLGKMQNSMHRLKRS